MTTETIFTKIIGEHFACSIEKRSDGKFSVISIFKGRTHHHCQAAQENQARTYADGLIDGFNLVNPDLAAKPFAKMEIAEH